MPAPEPLGPMVRIRALRDAYGLTAERLAERMAELGVPIDRNSLYNIERGAKKPSDRVLDAYARAVGVNPLDVWRGPLRGPAGADGPAAHPPPSPARPDAPTSTTTDRLDRRNRRIGMAEMLETMSGQDNRGVVWRGYTEPHAISDTGRKLGGTGRLAATPEVELRTPADVADWIRHRAAQVAKTADPRARQLNARKMTPWSVHRGVAARGRSVYASIHLAPGRVVDVCAEVCADRAAGGAEIMTGAMADTSRWVRRHRAARPR